MITITHALKKCEMSLHWLCLGHKEQMDVCVPVSKSQELFNVCAQHHKY